MQEHRGEHGAQILIDCVFDDCPDYADYELIAHWPDGQSSGREVCLVHVARGIESLQTFRELDAGAPVITQIALRD